MNINLTGSQFVLAEGFYYCPSFVQDFADELITVAIWTPDPATVSMQVSMDNIDWIDVPRSSFTCTVTALQSYNECQKDLFYRIKTNVAPSKCIIKI